VTAADAKGRASAIMVLGMHRSGTSAATRVLNLLGAHLGEDLLAAQADNARGFWENAGAVAIHERLLAGLGRTWHDTRELPHDWLHSQPARKALGEIVALIERDMEGQRLWAVKDPRMCRLAPLWIEALGMLGMDAKALIMVREPYEVASSLHARDGWSHSHAYLMWVQHLLEACHATTGIPRALLSYGRLMDDWSRQMVRVGRELGVAWNPDIDEAKSAVDAFLSPVERHHRVVEQPADMARDRLPPAYLEKLYHACAAIGRDGDWGRLDDLESRFAEVAALFARPMDETARDRDEALRLAQERIEFIHHLQRELGESTRSHAGMEALALERIERIHELQRELAESNRSHAGMEALALERIERIHQLEAERVKLVAERAAFEALAEERLARFQQMERNMAARDEETQRLRRQLETLRSLAGSRWWSLKRVLRPLRPVSPGEGEV